MTSKKTQTFTDLLGLPDLEVLSWNLDGEKLVIEVKQRSDIARCPNCNKESKNIIKYYPQRIRDCPVFGRACYLSLSVRRFDCEYCDKSFVEQLDSINLDSKHTKRYEKYIYNLCKRKNTFAHISSIENISYRKIIKIYHRFEKQIEEEAEHELPRGLITKREFENLSKMIEEKSCLFDNYINNFQELRRSLQRFHEDFETFVWAVLIENDKTIDSYERLIKNMLFLFDNFNDAVKAIDKNETTREDERCFIKSAYNRLDSILRRIGVSPIQVRVREELVDLNKHQVVGDILTSEYPEGTILEVVEQGYTLNSKTIKWAKVKIAKHKNEIIK